MWSPGPDGWHGSERVDAAPLCLALWLAVVLCGAVLVRASDYADAQADLARLRVRATAPVTSRYDAESARLASAVE